MTEQRSLPVPDGLAGERADTALSRMLGLSRAKAAELLEAGQATMDGRVLGKSDRLLAGGWLDVSLPSPTAPPPPPPQPVPGMQIRYEDADLVVVDKPVGVAAHPAPGWDGPTVIGALAAAGYRITTSGAEERQGVVHRLDVGTSGLMMVAKSEHAYSALKQAFRERTVTKIYHSVVQGHPDPSTGTIDAPIGRHPQHDYKWAVVAGGRESITHYTTLEAMRGASLLEVDLQTGRTHQIRVHAAAIGHPCAGDLTYGADPVLARQLALQRQWLHAMRLGFAHPATGQWTEISSVYPQDLAAALEELQRR